MVKPRINLNMSAPPGWVLLLTMLCLITSTNTWAEGFTAKPAAACDLLAGEGLDTRGGYRASGDVYQCRSRRRNLIGGGRVNNSIRFVAQGRVDAVTQLRLELQVNSRSAVQRAHRQLVDYGRSLIQAALGMDMPEEVEAAILSAVNGSWDLGGSTVRLERIVLGSPGYELRLRIQ